MTKIKATASTLPTVTITDYTISPHTLTLCLAYFQRYAPRRLDGRRLLPPSHINELVRWMGHHHRYIKTIRCHPILAGHIALLIAADLLILSDHALYPSLAITEWLNHAPHDQVGYLLQVLQYQDLWSATIETLGWNDILSIDMTTYLEQTLTRQLDLPAAAANPPVRWQTEANHDAWYLTLPTELPARLLFDLLQLGLYQPPYTLQLTPMTIASPPACHLGLDHICWLLETTTQSTLTRQQRQRLHEWLQRAHAYRIDGPLLSTANAEQMQTIYQNRRLRPYLLEQISPRHTLIDTALIPPLRRWLAGQGYPLNLPPAAMPSTGNDLAPSDDLATSWLGQRLLLGLQKYVRLPIPPPAAQQFRLEERMEPETVAELERLAQHLLVQLEDVIAGRDTFFPAWQSPSPQLITAIESAIASGRVLRIAYRGIGQNAAEWHEIEPLRLEKRAALTYLHAYSHRAGANRTFRLDRVTDMAYTIVTVSK